MRKIILNGSLETLRYFADRKNWLVVAHQTFWLYLISIISHDFLLIYATRQAEYSVIEHQLFGGV
jgi:hypothetical protein